jgi:hypothetical protein
MGESITPSLLIGVNVAQEQSLFTANIEDKIRIADQAVQQGDYERATLVYGLAEQQWIHDHPAASDKNWYYYDQIVMMERRKATAYQQWGGHEAHVAAAENTIRYASERSSEAAADERMNTGCLIVTATYGSPLSSEVQLVRDYRDGTIRQSYAGSRFFAGFNAWYYTFSPAVSGYIATHPLVKSVMQVCLVPLLAIVLLSQNLHSALGFSPELAAVSVLVFGAALYALVYILPPAAAMLWLAKSRGWRVPAPDGMKPLLVVWITLVCGLAAGIFLSLDVLTIATSGLLVACTIIGVAGTLSLTLMQYLEKYSERWQI